MKTSVIIPTFNRAELLHRALASVFVQTVLPDEVIVVDDGGNDNTKKIVKMYDAVYLYKKNGGVSSARNLGIEKAVGDFVFFLDSDDEWSCEKIEQQLLFHKNNPHIHFSHTDEKWIKNNKVIKQSKKHLKPSGFCFEENLAFCKIGASCLCVHKDVFKKLGVFNEELKVCEDYEFYLRVLEVYELGFIDQKLTTKYAGHEQLSFSCGNIDFHRIKALEFLLQSSLIDDYKKLVLLEIQRKKQWQ